MPEHPKSARHASFPSGRPPYSPFSPFPPAPTRGCKLHWPRRVRSGRAPHRRPPILKRPYRPPGGACGGEPWGAPPTAVVPLPGAAGRAARWADRGRRRAPLPRLSTAQPATKVG